MSGSQPYVQLMTYEPTSNSFSPYKVVIKPPGTNTMILSDMDNFNVLISAWNNQTNLQTLYLSEC